MAPNLSLYYRINYLYLLVQYYNNNLCLCYMYINLLLHATNVVIYAY